MSTNHIPMIPETNDEPASKSNKTKKPLSVWQRSWTIKLIKHELFPVVFTVFGVILACAIVYVAVKSEDWWTKQIFISKVNIVKVAKAAEIEPVFPDIGDCEQYRPIVQKYFGKLTNEALFVASKESGCIADRISPKNSNGSRDYCLFQINSEPLTAQSLDTCVRRAWEKYVDGRIGHRNYSAWYAVCDTNGHPKYPKIISDCS